MWRLTVLSIIVLGAAASACAVLASVIRDFDEGMAWE